MKTFISSVILLGLGINLLGSAPTTANTNVLAQSRTNATTKAEEFTALGTEPFWGISISKSGIVYSPADGAKQKFAYVAPLQAAGRPADYVRVYRFKDRANSVLILKKNTCSDGMSDNVYPYSATFMQGSFILEGCARRK